MRMDHRVRQDWLTGDSLMKRSSAIGQRGGLSYIIQEQPGGELTEDRAKRHMQTMPCVSGIHISLVDYILHSYGFQ